MAAEDRHLLARYVADRSETAFEGLVRRHGPIALPCRAGEHQVVQLTRYDDDSNLFLAIRVGAALGAETKPAAPAER